MASEHDRASEPGVAGQTPESLPEAGGTTVVLRPTPAFLEMHAAGHSLPFYQAVPLPQGRFTAYPGGITLSAGGEAVPGRATVSAHWPDGSAQWLAVSGIWPAGIPLDNGTSIQLAAGAPAGLPPQPFAIRLAEGGAEVIEILDSAGGRIARLRPTASVLQITEPKARDSREPEDLDTRVQYAWAERHDRLNPRNGPTALSLRAMELVVEEETPTSTLYRIRGNGGDTEPGRDFEWQMRVRIFRQTPVIRFQATWFFHGDPDRFALTDAEWHADLDGPLLTADGAGRSFDLAGEPLSLASLPDGRNRLVQGNDVLLDNEWPAPELHVWTVQSGLGSIGLGVPDLTRLGPNRLTLGRDGIILACWDGLSGLGLDLRRTVERDEFMMNDYDFDATAQGVSRTVEMVWAMTGDSGSATAMTRAETARDGLWFASRADLIASGALGPWQEGTWEHNRIYAEALGAQIHWVRASRDHWRWNGFINFGDIRTNWHRTGYRHGDSQEYQVHPMMWGMNGRYGWRNGAGEPYRGFLAFGLWAEDREIMLFAYDYARHVADVDVVHGRFGETLRGDQGGMHRRNKNHWSGAVQMQYTPSRGLYLARWLTGFERFNDALVGIRDYAARHARGSVFGASAWLSHYSETLDPSDLATAERLLGLTIGAWEERNQEFDDYRSLRGLAALHAGNFRKYLDWWPIQIEFHRATGNPVYLEALAEDVRTDPFTRVNEIDLSRYLATAYLLHHGYTEADLGAEKIGRMREALAQRRWGTNPPRTRWNYETLVRNRATFQTFELGCRAANAPVAFTRFDSAEASE